MSNNQKVAIVTGGSRGLGKNMATSLAQRGIDVIITYRQQKEKAQETVKEITDLGRKASAMQLDMAKFHSLDGFVKELQQVLRTHWGSDHFDFLINNAGMGAGVPFLDVDERLFDDFMNVHFKSIYFLTQKCVPFMNEGGRIINISTGTTRFSYPGYSVYASVKGAIEVFTKYLAKELGSRGIGANVIAPGPIETDFNNAAIRSNPQLKAALNSLSPFGRVGDASDIGGVAAFLCTNDASWINGQRIEVSGGINV